MNNQNNTKEKKNAVYTKDDMIKNISKKCRISYYTVRNIYNTLEEDIANILSSANKKTDVTIRLFEGISLNSTYVPEEVRQNNLTGETITSMSKIRPKANITRSYRERITGYNK